ncbi:hypothetical protein DFH07DRAFT_955875 [Mycena maculata]|uniref:Uncharacterized protein n=1 Tax=Mycena maculata TaxID=230809 RepID=A0AAD7NKY7_9AGAR|nr:hypothetical protein DFH07DRAFT_955875 [Mycena maculata]
MPLPPSIAEPRFVVFCPVPPCPALPYFNPFDFRFVGRLPRPPARRPTHLRPTTMVVKSKRQKVAVLAQAMRYIDEYASNADDSGNSDVQDDPDSYEAQVRATDQHDFGAGSIAQMQAAQMDPLAQGHREQRAEALTTVLENLRDQEQHAKEPVHQIHFPPRRTLRIVRPPPPSSPPLHPLKPCSPEQPRRTENGPSPPRLYRGVRLPHLPPPDPATPGPLLINVAVQTHRAEPHAVETRRPDSLTWKLQRTGTPKKKTKTKRWRTSVMFIDDSVRDDEQGSRTGDRRRAPPPLGRLIEEEEPEDLHALADKITERHCAQRPILQYNIDADVEHISLLISAHARSPTPQDPCLFHVVVPHGESQLFISRCMTELLSPHMPICAQLLCNIFISLFHRPGDPHVYIEATPGDMFDQELQRLHARIDKLIPLSERLALLHLPPPSALKTG